MLLMISAAMMSGSAMMFRMDIFAYYLADEGREEGALAAAACMNTEPYDTHKVPYCKHYCEYFMGHISHLTRKCTKNIQM